jgi:hypothetical protein
MTKLAIHHRVEFVGQRPFDQHGAKSSLCWRPRETNAMPLCTGIVEKTL